MRTFATYPEARAFAQTMADESGLDIGLRFNRSGEIVIRFLPRADQRAGDEIACETVYPSGPAKPGHGWEATRDLMREHLTPKH